jgi:hypothetical protein
LFVSEQMFSCRSCRAAYASLCPKIGACILSHKLLIAESEFFWCPCCQWCIYEWACFLCAKPASQVVILVSVLVRTFRSVSRTIKFRKHLSLLFKNRCIPAHKRREVCCMNNTELMLSRRSSSIFGVSPVARTSRVTCDLCATCQWITASVKWTRYMRVHVSVVYYHYSVAVSQWLWRVKKK